MIRMFALTAIFAFVPWPAFADTLLDVIRGIRAQNGIMVLVEPGNAVCEDAFVSGFAVLALGTPA